MKIALLMVGDRLKQIDAETWLYFYQQSKSNLDVVLIYDNKTNKEILDFWPYSKIENKVEFKIKKVCPTHFVDQFIDFTYVDTLKMSAYKQIGECIVIDYDTVICKKIDINQLPICDFAMAPHHHTSSFFNKEKQFCDIIEFDQIDFCRWANSGVQIQRRDMFDQYLDLLSKNFYRVHSVLDFVCYGQTIAGLTLRLYNGVYLGPEWNWYFDSPIENNSIIIKHYYGKKGKSEFRKLLRGDQDAYSNSGSN